MHFNEKVSVDYSFCVGAQCSAAVTNLVAVDTYVMSGDKSLEDNHPAGVGGSLKQRVSHLRDVYIGGVGG